MKIRYHPTVLREIFWNYHLCDSSKMQHILGNYSGSSPLSIIHNEDKHKVILHAGIHCTHSTSLLPSAK